VGNASVRQWVRPINVTVLTAPPEDNFEPDATVTVTLVSPVLLGDADQDGAVTFADIPAIIGILLAGTFVDQADCNQDGVVNFSDIPPFIAILVAQ